MTYHVELVWGGDDAGIGHAWESSQVFPCLETIF
jgi:hypothetical protein